MVGRNERQYLADHIAELVKLQQSDIGEVVMSSLPPATTH